MAQATELIQFAGLIIPISAIALRLFLDQVGISDAAPDQTKARDFTKYPLWMLGLLIVASWLGIIGVLFPAHQAGIVQAGYVIAGIALALPAVMLWRLREEFETPVF